MINSFINMPSTIQTLKLRDRKENEVRLAVEHQRLMRQNCHIYQSTANQTIKRFEQWCKHRNVETTLNIEELYKQVNE